MLCDITFDASTIAEFHLDFENQPMPAGMVWKSDVENPLDELLVVRNGVLTFLLQHGYVFLPCSRTILAKFRDVVLELSFDCGTLKKVHRIH